MKKSFIIEQNNNLIIINFKDNNYQKLAMSDASCYLEDPIYYKSYIYKTLLFTLNLECLKYEGHNFPLNNLLSYYNLSIKKKDLLKEEKDIYSKLKKYLNKNKYIITQYSNKKYIFNHEYMHAYYFFNIKYQLYIQSIWEIINKNIKTIIINYLISYHKSLLLDEFQAYITTEPLIFITFGKKIKKKKD